MTACGIDANRFAAVELASEQLASEWIFQLMLDCAFERSRSVNRIETDITEQIERGFAYVEFQLTFGKPSRDVFNLDARNLANLRLVQ